MPVYVYHNRGKISTVLLLFALLFQPAIALAKTPNDPDASQWSYRDTKAFEAWDLATGSRDVIVAIIDNGFDTFHPELASNVWKNEDEIPNNGMDDDANGYVDDIWGWNFVPEDKNGDGGFSEEELKGNNDPRPSVFEVTAFDIEDGSLHHGTLVAGIIGAKANNNKFSAGVSWEVSLMNLKVVGNSGNIAVAQLAKAIYYAVDNGAHIINISLVGPADQTDLKDAVRYAYERGVAVVAAAGNDYIAFEEYPKYPICADAGESEQWVLGVSGINEAHFLAQFSNRGGGCIDITAPAVHISSTMRYAPRYGLEKMYGGTFSGTSFAAPFVSGAAALIKSIHPEWGPKEIFDAILKNVHKTPPLDEAEYTRYFGAGLVQIDRAVKAALAKIIGFHALSSIVAYAPESQTIGEERVKGSAEASVPATNLLAKAKALAQYRRNGERGYVGVFPKGRNKNEVILLDESWRVVSRWETLSSSAVSLAVGDVAGDNAPEIIVAPKSPNTLVFRVYGLDGKQLATHRVKANHRGVHLGLVDNAKKKKQEILAVYADTGVQLHRFNDAFAVALTIDLPHVRNTAAVGAGDIDGDGLQEYVVGSGAGDGPRVAYYDEDGAWKRTFFAYDPVYLGGVRVIVGDYTMDGKDDVIVSGEIGGQSVRVWDDRSRRLAEWWPFGPSFRSSISLVGRYRSLLY